MSFCCSLFLTFIGCHSCWALAPVPHTFPKHELLSITDLVAFINLPLYGVAVHLFQKHFIEYLKRQFCSLPRKIFYASDGAASRHKNQKNFINLCHHEEDFGVAAKWQFSATSHWKGACDRVGGTVKRLAAKASLQRPYDQQIMTPRQLFDWAVDNIPAMAFKYLNMDDYKSEQILLEQRFKQSCMIHELVNSTVLFHKSMCDSYQILYQLKLKHLQLKYLQCLEWVGIWMTVRAHEDGASSCLLYHCLHLLAEHMLTTNNHCMHMSQILLLLRVLGLPPGLWLYFRDSWRGIHFSRNFVPWQCTLPYTHIILPHPHTCHQRCAWLCCSCVPAEHHCCLASPINTGGRKWTTHHPPSLDSEQTIHILLTCTLALNNIHSAPAHHSLQCVWTLRTVCTEV